MTRSTKPTFNRLQVVLQTFDTKIEQLKKLDENISCKIEQEKELESEIVEADDYLGELMDKASDTLAIFLLRWLRNG
jgi:vacuolar-type H+-ATPase subunit I/STV1